MSLTDRDTIKAAAEIDNLHVLKEFIVAHARKAGFEEKPCGQIELAVDELLTNVISYAYPEEPGSVTVRCVTNSDGDLFIQIADSGIPFDPLRKRAPDFGTSIENSKIGGLGIHLARQMLDEMKYARKGDLNILTVCKKRGEKS